MIKMSLGNMVIELFNDRATHRKDEIVKTFKNHKMFGFLPKTEFWANVEFYFGERIGLFFDNRNLNEYFRPPSENQVALQLMSYKRNADGNYSLDIKSFYS